MSTGKASPPRDLGIRGRAFWRSTHADFVLDASETELLAEVCRGLDELDRLRELLEEDGMRVRGSMGQAKVHPALSEIRQTRDQVARLVRQLDLPEPALDGAAADRSQRAREAAQERWRAEKRRAGRGA